MRRHPETEAPTPANTSSPGACAFTGMSLQTLQTRRGSASQFSRRKSTKEIACGWQRSPGGELARNLCLQRKRHRRRHRRRHAWPGLHVTPETSLGAERRARKNGMCPNPSPERPLSRGCSNSSPAGLLSAHFHRVVTHACDRGATMHFSLHGCTTRLHTAALETHVMIRRSSLLNSAHGINNCADAGLHACMCHRLATQSRAVPTNITEGIMKTRMPRRTSNRSWEKYPRHGGRTPGLSRDRARPAAGAIEKSSRAGD